MGRKKAKITVITMFIFVLIVISIVVVDFLLVKDKLKEELTVEAGSEMPVASDFLLKDYKRYELTAGLDEEVTDLGGNTTSVDTEVTVVKDTEPPVITGVTEQTIPAGTSVSYKRGVTVTDNHDEDVQLVIDNSEVNLDEVGDYTVRYLATDKAGNTTEVITVLHVEPPSAENATEELVNKMADEVLAEILTEDMTEYEKAEAIFWWVHDIRYKNGTPKTNWVQGAYHGLAEYSGDCFVYAMTAKCLLTRAGIKNMDIEKIPAYTSHYWNLIDLGDGWYHYDCCNGRMEGTYIFYWTDEQLMEYSENHNDSHNYDREKYSDIQ